MLSYMPLDDALNCLFYVDDGTWRLIWTKAIGRCVLRRESIHIPFFDAVTKIGKGELLWTPPDRFQPLDGDSSVDAVQREVILLDAFLRSPTGQRMTRWTERQRLELRAGDLRDWLASRTLTRDDSDWQGDE